MLESFPPLRKALLELRCAVVQRRSDAYCLRLWSVFVRLRDECCVICCTTDQLTAHHIVRKSFLVSARFETGNGITLCRGCHREPHETFNGRPDLMQPMDAQGGENVELLAGLYGALVNNAKTRGLLLDDYYYLSDRTIEVFKRFQGFDQSHRFPGTRLEQAYLIWRNAPVQLMRFLLEANGEGPEVVESLLEARGIQRAYRSVATGHASAIGSATTENRRPEWQLQKQIMENLQATQEFCVTPDALVVRRSSGEVHRIDVLIDSKHDAPSRLRVIVDAKPRPREVDVRDVEEFEILMQDVGATHGYLVAVAGRSEMAQRRAQSTMTISIVPAEHIAQIDPSKWPRCLGKDCGLGRVFWDGYPELSSQQPFGAAASFYVTWVHYVGKCDRCGRFHMYCATCKTLLSFTDDEGEHQCACKMPWFWLASIEEGENGEACAELHVITASDGMTVNRRPLANRLSST